MNAFKFGEVSFGCLRLRNLCDAERETPRKYSASLRPTSHGGHGLATLLAAVAAAAVAAAAVAAASLGLAVASSAFASSSFAAAGRRLSFTASTFAAPTSSRARRDAANDTPRGG